jgi:hypothetical protein
MRIDERRVGVWVILMVQMHSMMAPEHDTLSWLARSQGGNGMHTTTYAPVWLGRVFLFFLLMLALTGCDADEDSVLVEFTVRCSAVSCFNVDVTDSFITDDGTEFIICEWFCGDYRAFDDEFVELTFERRPGSCFELRSEFVADGIC